MFQFYSLTTFMLLLSMIFSISNALPIEENDDDAASKVPVVVVIGDDAFLLNHHRERRQLKNGGNTMSLASFGYKPYDNLNLNFKPPARSFDWGSSSSASSSSSSGFQNWKPASPSSNFNMNANVKPGNKDNWGVNVGGAYKTPVWQSQDKLQSIDVGGSYSRGFGKNGGNPYTTNTFGANAGYNWHYKDNPQSLNIGGSYSDGFNKNGGDPYTTNNVGVNAGYKWQSKDQLQSLNVDGSYSKGSLQYRGNVSPAPPNWSIGVGYSKNF